jgi:hypothetical protein
LLANAPARAREAELTVLCDNIVSQCHEIEALLKTDQIVEYRT